MDPEVPRIENDWLVRRMTLLLPGDLESFRGLHHVILWVDSLVRVASCTMGPFTTVDTTLPALPTVHSYRTKPRANSPKQISGDYR